MGIPCDATIAESSGVWMCVFPTVLLNKLWLIQSIIELMTVVVLLK
jgi:hypothetical protein